MDMENEDVWVTPPFSRGNGLCRQLQELDATLRCEICGELYANPVSLNKCQHTFCSKCIRDTLTEQSGRVRQGGPTCPSCRTPLDGRRYDANYRPNRSLERAVSVFCALRQPLHAVLVQQAAAVVVAATAATTANNNNNNNGTNGAATAAASTTTTTAAAAMDEPTDASNTTTTRFRRGSKRAATNEIAATPAETTTTTTTTQLPEKRRKIYSHYKKRRDLEQLCRDEGIADTSGTESELKRRHERFVNFYNAHRDNLGAARTKTAAQIVREFNAQETARSRLAAQDWRQRAALDRLYQEAAAGGNGVGGNSSCTSRGGAGAAAASDAFRAEVNANFRDLIAKARRHKQQKQQEQQQNQQQPPCEPMQTEAVSMDEPKGSDQLVMMMMTTTTPTPDREHYPTASDSSPELTNEITLHEAVGTGPPLAPPGEPVAAKQDGSTTMETRAEAFPSGADIAMGTKADDRYHATIATLTTRRSRSSKQAKPTFSRERSVSRGDSLVGPWQCPLCTFVNRKNTWSRASCEMCETARPKPNMDVSSG